MSEGHLKVRRNFTAFKGTLQTVPPFLKPAHDPTQLQLAEANQQPSLGFIFE